MDKIIVTALLIVAGVISAILVYNAIYPAIVQSGDAITSMERRIDDRMKSQIEIIHAVKSSNDVVIWIKNVGDLRIAGLESCDLFFGPEGNFARIAYGGTGSPRWEQVVENGTQWNPSTTIKVTIIGYGALPAGRYFAKFVLPNGISDEYFFSW